MREEGDRKDGRTEGRFTCSQCSWIYLWDSDTAVNGPEGFGLDRVCAINIKFAIASALSPGLLAHHEGLLAAMQLRTSKRETTSAITSAAVWPAEQGAAKRMYSALRTQCT